MVRRFHPRSRVNRHRPDGGDRGLSGLVLSRVAGTGCSRTTLICEVDRLWEHMGVKAGGVGLSNPGGGLAGCGVNFPNIPKMYGVFFDPFGLVEGGLCAGRWWSVGDHAGEAVGRRPEAVGLKKVRGVCVWCRWEMRVLKGSACGLDMAGPPSVLRLEVWQGSGGIVKERRLQAGDRRL